MSRISVTVRPARRDDVPVLREIWGPVLRRTDEAGQLADLARVVEEAAESEDDLVAVAEHDGQVAGAVYLRATALSPLNPEEAVLALSPHVLPGFRRHGVGTALMEASVRFAEERGIPFLASAAAAEWRDANRFLARLSLVPHAVLRLAPTSVVRSRLSATRPPIARTPGRPQSIDRVLAARRVRRSERAGSR